MASCTSCNDDDLPYCWCTADPTKVEMNHSLPSPRSELAKVYEEHLESRQAAFPYRLATDIVHKDCKGMIRQRGLYWWISEQIKLEDKIMAGTLRPVVDRLYCFLEEEHTPGYDILGKPMPGTDTSKPITTVLFRYGNVLSYDSIGGYYWRVQSVAVPKGHPDANAYPYRMIDVSDRSHLR